MSSEQDLRSTWESLRAIHTGLPPELRGPQLDAIHWLSERKHVILCVGTGGGASIPFQFVFHSILRA